MRAQFICAVKDLREFDIALARLGNKKHLYEWTVGNKFFKSFPASPLENANVEVALEMEKSETMLQLDFKMKGALELVCDRSLEVFDYPFESKKKLILKFGESAEILSDEIEIIHRDEQVINVAQYIYEFICLTIPMKKIHPRFLDEGNENEEEGGILIYSSEVDEETEGDENEVADPRWEVLKKLKKED